MIPRVVDDTDTYTKTTQQQMFYVLRVQRAFVASLRVIQGLPLADTVDPDKPLRNYKDAMSPLTIRNGTKHTKKNPNDSRTEGFSVRLPKGAKTLGLPRVSIIKSIMVYWIT
jgi:hypothetical protein